MRSIHTDQGLRHCALSKGALCIPSQPHHLLAREFVGLTSPYLRRIVMEPQLPAPGNVFIRLKRKRQEEPATHLGEDKGYYSNPNIQPTFMTDAQLLKLLPGVIRGCETW